MEDFWQLQALLEVVELVGKKSTLHLNYTLMKCD